MTVTPPKKPQSELVDQNPVPVSTEKWGKPGFFDKSLSKGPKTTTWIWNLHADAHDFDKHSSNQQENSRKIFAAHFAHLGIIFVWMSSFFFQGARFSNYTGWLADPTHVKPGAQVVWPILGQEILNGDQGAGYHGIRITSGIFQMWRAWGITNETELMALALGALVMAAVMFNAGAYHFHIAAPKLAWFQNVESMMNHHLAGLLGLGSLGWAGHLIHISIPTNMLLDAIDAGTPMVLNGRLIETLTDIPPPHVLCNPSVAGQIIPGLSSGVSNFFSLNWMAFTDFLTFKGGLNPVTGSLWMTDIAHHHLAIAVMFIIAGHMYRTNWGIGQSMKEILDGQNGFPQGVTHRGLYEFLAESRHAQLSLNLAMLGSISIIVSHHMYAMPPYPYLGIEYPTVVGLFTHHMWIGGFLIVGAGAHASIAMIRDYNPVQHMGNVLDRILKSRDAIISHLNWVCIFLGFHSFGLYIHNDIMRALGRPNDLFSDTAIQLQPVFAQSVQRLHASLYNVSDVFGGSTTMVGGKIANAPFVLGTADFMIHHIHAFQIHVCVLILLKGVLYSRNSQLIPDKSKLGFRFPCDGPGRGGTCQVSGWDHVFLGLFWMYNCISIVIFHFSWRMQDVWGLSGGNFAQSSITINGWLRDFLWSQSSQVLNSYGQDISMYGLLFLGAHFVWAFSLMFLWSGRGYWQELIESIAWAHNKLKLAPTIQPRAMSITQGRAVGVAHFLLGGIATTWAFFFAHLIPIS